MLGTSKRIAIAGLLGIGAALSAAGAGLGRAIHIVPPSQRLTDDGLPVHKRTPSTGRNGHSVAQGKRNARKARNVARHKRAAKGA